MSNALSNVPPPEHPATPIAEKDVAARWLAVKNLLGSTRGKIGAIFAGAPLWKLAYDAIDAWGNAQMVWPYLHIVIDFFGTNWGSLTLMALGFLLIAWQIRRQHHMTTLPRQSSEPPALAVVKEPCPDKWLHDIAENDKRFIDKFVKVAGGEIFGHDFLHTAPYVDFKFTVLNASVYAICIEEPVKGDIRFQSQLLSKDIKIIENPARYIEHGKTQYLIVRQWLSREEVKCILSASDGEDAFRFTGMELMIKCCFPETDVEHKRLDVYGLNVSSKRVRDLHKQLGVLIQQARYKGHWNVADRMEWRRLLVNLQVSIVNTRPAPIAIRGFKLSGKIKSSVYEVNAEEGEIYEERYFTEEGEELFEGQELNNLNPEGSTLLMIAPDEKSEGWLQFVLIPDPLDVEDDEIPATLTFTDSAGETHSAECRLIYAQ